MNFADIGLYFANQFVSLAPDGHMFNRYKIVYRLRVVKRAAPDGSQLRNIHFEDTAVFRRYSI